MLNERSNEYFTKTLAMSGTGISFYSYVEGDHRCLIREFAARHNVSIGDNVEELIQFMKDASEKDIIEFVAELHTHHEPTVLSVEWWPIIEGLTSKIFILITKHFVFLTFSDNFASIIFR